MKKWIFLFGLMSLSIVIKAQENAYLENYHSFLKSQYGDRYIDKGDIKTEIDRYDFSSLWILPGSTDADMEFPSERPDLMGFIGDDYQRIYIHFIQITKNIDIPNEYFVYGKSNVKGNICDFIGTFKIELAREISFDYHPGQDFCVNIDSVKRQGVIVCKYNLYEDPKQKHAGKFRGLLTTSFFIDTNNKLNYNAIECFSDSYINNQFVGTWTNYKTSKAKDCNFGERRIPDSGDLDIGAGGFIPNEKYYDKGWNPNETIPNDWWE